MIKEMDNIYVECKQGNCVWNGRMGDWKAHACPTAEYKQRSIAELHQLMLHDDRVHIKARVMNELGSRLVDATDTDNKRDLCMLMVSYMKKFRHCDELLESGLQSMLMFLKSPGGLSFVECCYRDFWVFVAVECRAPCLKPIVCQIWSVRTEGSGTDAMQRLLAACAPEHNATDV